MSDSEPKDEPVTDESRDEAEAAVETTSPSLEEQLAEAVARHGELEDRIKRIQAEFKNESARLKRNAEGDRKFAIERVVVDLLPVADALHSAMASLGDDEAANAMRDGLSMVGKQLHDALGRHGAAQIEAEVGQAFDPAQHEALFTQQTDEVPPQTVWKVLRPGYTLNDRVVRAAEVAVAIAPPTPNDGGPTDGDA